MSEQDKKDLILIVDDNPENIEFLANLLQEKGYDLAFALNGEKALEVVVPTRPELILLDVMMPEMDGYEVCRKLKTFPACKHIPVIFLTAKTDTDDIIRGFDVGGNDYVTKPFNSRELLVRIRNQLELKKSKEEIKTLRGLIPICSYCKNIRDDKGYWAQLETYMSDHTDAVFTHGVCPACHEKVVTELRKGLKKKGSSGEK